LGKERKFVWVVIGNFRHSILHEHKLEKRGEDLGSWNNKDRQILEHARVILEHFGVGN
jgi:hypothetical protein